MPMLCSRITSISTWKGNQEAYRRYVAGFIADEDDVLTGAMKESRQTPNKKLKATR